MFNLQCLSLCVGSEKADTGRSKQGGLSNLWRCPKASWASPFLLVKSLTVSLQVPAVHLFVHSGISGRNPVGSNAPIHQSIISVGVVTHVRAVRQICHRPAFFVGRGITQDGQGGPVRPLYTFPCPIFLQSGTVGPAEGDGNPPDGSSPLLPTLLPSRKTQHSGHCCAPPTRYDWSRP